MKEKEKKYETFEEMYLSTYKLVYAFAWNYTEEWSVAEEVASIVWARIAECPEFYLEKEILHLHNYMHVMVKNEICEIFRRREQQRKKIDKIATSLSSPRTVEEEYMLQEDLRMLEEARTQLSREENLILNLKYDKELSAKEVGKVLDINEGNVRIKQYRILRKLRKMMSE